LETSGNFSEFFGNSESLFSVTLFSSRFHGILVSMTAMWLLPFPELRCVSLEWADADAGKFGVNGVRGVFTPSLKMSMLGPMLQNFLRP